MIYNTNNNPQNPHQSENNSYPYIPGLNKPTYPKDIQKILPTLVKELNLATIRFLEKYAWLDYPSTIINTKNKTTTYTNASLGIVKFNSFYIGNYDTIKKIWSWSWLVLENENFEDHPIFALRDYGFRKKIDVLTQPKWQASNQDKIQVLAMVFNLKNGAAIEFKQENDFEYFYLLMDEKD